VLHQIGMIDESEENFEVPAASDGQQQLRVVPGT
jgi:hypothetical protein